VEAQNVFDAEDKLLRALFDVALKGPRMSPAALDFLLEAVRPALMDLSSEWAQGMYDCI
jgi:hypothetical protein